ncbi:hypothetical protein E8E13_004172 [Curvularia kusanoi]|uniref:Methyltransferase domain-containing protein n=1 Tax=Curvularia kusanoi TaxID=90978 RepID=A0A9P4TAS6_CURKU|nr:hypothetical protein E8E13_004172 [Curvularia kusanoi]
MSTTSDSYAPTGARLHHFRETAHDGSWQSDLAQTISSYVPNLSSNDRILHLTESTGLSTFALATQFHDASIISVEPTSGSLDTPQSKHSTTTGKDTQIEVYEHDILDLDSLAAVQNGAFDVIVCVLEVALLQDPCKALAYWYRCLAPGAVIVLCVKHPQNLIAGVVLNRTATKLGVSALYHHTWSQSEESLRDVFDKTNLEVLNIRFANRKDEDRMSHSTEDGVADALFEAQLRSPIGDAFRVEAARSPDFLTYAREVFRDEWATQRFKAPSEEIWGHLIGVAQCGSPVSMVFDGTKGYEDEKGKTKLVLGSVDMDSLDHEAPQEKIYYNNY